MMASYPKTLVRQAVLKADLVEHKSDKSETQVPYYVSDDELASIFLKHLTNHGLCDDIMS